jgi:hypothetical protein
LIWKRYFEKNCIAVSVVSAAVGVTTTIVGGAVDVVDAVTPDIFDDDDEQAEDDDNDNDNDNDKN